MRVLVGLLAMVVLVGCRKWSAVSLAPTSTPTPRPVPQYRLGGPVSKTTPQPTYYAGWGELSFKDLTGSQMIGTVKVYRSTEEYIVKAQVEKMPLLGPGEYFEVWLRQENQEEAPLVSLGKLEADAAPRAYYLRAELDPSYGAGEFLVTQESVDDHQPEKRLLST